jgi:hypothetical protein
MPEYVCPSPKGSLTPKISACIHDGEGYRVYQREMPVQDIVTRTFPTLHNTRIEHQ